MSLFLVFSTLMYEVIYHRKWYARKYHFPFQMIIKHLFFLFQSETGSNKNIFLSYINYPSYILGVHPKCKFHKKNQCGL